MKVKRCRPDYLNRLPVLCGGSEATMFSGFDCRFDNISGPHSERAARTLPVLSTVTSTITVPETRSYLGAGG